MEASSRLNGRLGGDGMLVVWSSRRMDVEPWNVRNDGLEVILAGMLNDSQGTDLMGDVEEGAFRCWVERKEGCDVAAQWDLRAGWNLNDETQNGCWWA